MRELQAKIDKTSMCVSSILLGAMMAIIAYNVVARFTGGGIKWYMESAQYLNVWGMFIAGIGLCVTSDHLRITLMEDLLPGRWKTGNKILVGIVTFLFYAFLTYGTYLLASRSKQVISTMQNLKMAYVYWLMPISSGLSAVSVILGLVIQLKEKDEDGGNEYDRVFID